MWNISILASRALLRISILLLCALPIHGQTASTGAIAGTVRDPRGALVAGSAIVVKSQATHEERDLATDAEGNFSVPLLTPGNYNLTVRAPAKWAESSSLFQVLISNGSEASRLWTTSAGSGTGIAPWERNSIGLGEMDR